MTEAEFDTTIYAAILAVLKQGRRSMGEEPEGGFPRCAYRGDGNLKCVVGHMIPDALYSQDMEGHGCNDAVVYTALGKLGLLDGPGRDLLLEQLQTWHDVECKNVYSSVREWRAAVIDRLPDFIDRSRVRDMAEELL